jgi:flavin-dependent dehydrogenase
MITSRSRIAENHVNVIGGGPAGVATTLALLDRGFQVTLIERSEYDDVRVGEHLNPQAVPLLAQLGVLKVVLAGRHRPCPGIRSAWGSATLGDNEYIFSPYGDGLNLSRPDFDATLAEQAERRGATVLRGTRVFKANRVDGEWALTLSRNGKRFTRKADFLVDATGREAGIARALKRSQIAYDRLIGIVGFMTPLPFDGTVDSSILVEACQDGWWYSAPLSDGRLVAAYMTDADFLSGIPDRPVDFWIERLKQSSFTRTRSETLESALEVHVRSARSQRLDEMIGVGWLAVGDAAMSFDPLSSAGISKALKWGIRAAEAIQSHFAGETDGLARYEKDVKRAFDDYLSLRAHYYRVEARWPDSIFWQRRHRSQLFEIPVTVDPLAVVTVPETVQPGMVRRFLEEMVPGLNGEFLVQLAQSPKPAHRLVSLLKAETKGRYADRDIIIAIQSLLSEGLLVRIDGG